MIIYLDELYFTNRSLLMKDYSSKNTNLSVDMKEVYQGFRNVIAAMTEENGVDLCTIYDKTIKAEDFVGYLRGLRQKHRKTPLSLLCDNWSVHKAKIVEEELERLNIRRISNVSYSPEFNPIEAVFSGVKR